MKRDKILLVTNTSWYAYNFYREFILYLASNNLDVYVITPDSEYFEQLEQLGVITKKIEFSRKGFNPFSELLFIFRLSLFYAKIKPKFVFNFTIKPNIWSGFVCRFMNIPCVNTISGLGSSFISDNFVKRITSMLYSLGCSRSVDNLVMNEEDYVEMSNILGSNVNKISGTGIDLGYFKYVEPQVDVDFRFLFVGRLLKDKGIIELLDGFYAIKNSSITLDIVGDFDLGNPTSISPDCFYEKINRDSRVKFHGYQEDIRPLIINTNFVILPSYREGLPRVLMESLAIGRPILGSDVPGCRDLINPFTGFIFDSHSTISLVNCIESVINLSYSDYLSLSRSARSYAEAQLDLEKVISHYYSYLNDSKCESEVI
ncbi:putative Glycosyl transferase [Vibrio chagasii]|nr:putative Glycosyl transferase [Vibrio chagasii]CAH7414991.1 putative Glycosyl transferase [Vibrio chagasii]